MEGVRRIIPQLASPIFRIATRNLSIQRWLPSYFAVLLIGSLAAGLSFTGRVLLQRVLTTTHVANLALLLALFQVIGSVATWGQGTVILRTYSQARPGTYNYRADLRRTVVPSVWIAGTLALLAVLAYRLPAGYALFLIGSSLLLSIVLILTKVLRSQRMYPLASLLDRSPYALMILVALVAVLLLPNLSTALIGQFALLAITSALAFAIVLRKVPEGHQILSSLQRREGAGFVFQQLAFMATYHGGLAIIGFLLAPVELAIYSVVLNLMRPFDLFRSSLQTVLITETARSSRLILPRIVLLASIPLVALAAMYLAWGKEVMSFLFSGRYDSGLSLLMAFIPAAFFQALYAVPFSVMMGRSDPGALRKFIRIDALLALLGLGLLWIATLRWMVLGTALSTAVIWMVRTVNGLLMCRKIEEKDNHQIP